jgi:hypothetical protein
MGIKSDMVVSESSANIAPIHQENNNIKNLVHINNLTRTSLNVYNNRNVPTNKDTKTGKHNIDTLSMNQDHPRKAILHNKNNNIDLTILHHNIRGLCNKVDELVNSWTTQSPHILCLTEHHLHNHEINSTCIQYYNLGARYCRKNCNGGGVSIFVHVTLLFSNIELDGLCKDQDLEVCAVQLHFSSIIFHILCVYRPPTGNFSYFLSSLESILNQIYSITINVIICGDININYLDNTNNKLQLDPPLASYNFYSIVDFPTRISNCPSTAVDNIFIDVFINTNFTIKPLPNGLSDHDA